MDYGHGSSLTDLLRPREEMQTQGGEALATTKCQVNPQEPAYRAPGLQDTSYYPKTSLHLQHTSPQHCLGLDIVASHLTSTHLVGGQQQQQVHLNSSAAGGGHLTRPRQQANFLSSLSSSSSSSPPTAQHYPDFPTLLQFAPEPLSPPGSHQHQYTLPCNRRLSQPATVHLEKTWSHLEPPERFSHPLKKASGPFENTKGLQQQSKVQQPQSQPRKAPLPPLQTPFVTTLAGKSATERDQSLYSNKVSNSRSPTKIKALFR